MDSLAKRYLEQMISEIGELPAARIGRIAGALSFYDADVLVTGGGAGAPTVSPRN